MSVILPLGAEAKLEGTRFAPMFKAVTPRIEAKQLINEDRFIVSEEHDVYEKINFKYSGHLNASASALLR